MKKYKYYLSVILSIIININWLRSRLGKIVYRDGAVFNYRNIMDLWTVSESYLLRDYERNGVSLGDNWTIVDIGACLGDFSILAAKTSPKNIIFAIEPDPVSFSILQKNIVQNKKEDIVCSNVAISSQEGFVSMDINHRNFANNQTKTAKTGRIKSLTLKKYFSNNEINFCDLLKCDCEGAEFDIFPNIDKLTYSKIKRIVMEYHLFRPDYNLSWLVEVLKNHGFKVKITPNPVHSNIGFLYAHKD